MADSISLNEIDRAMLSGDAGPAKQMAMRILVRMSEIAGAASLLDIKAAHIDSTVYIGEAGLAYAERLASLGARVAVPTTLNVSGVDEHHWREWAVPEDWAKNARRQMKAYQSMGAEPTWTCAPYQTEFRPKFGQQIAWGESNAIVFANSVIGARTERYPDLFDVCCAITGRAPAMGLHLTENRAGQILLRLKDIPAKLQERDDFYPVLGHMAGKLAGGKIPVIDGLAVRPNEDQLKGMGAAAACSGAVAMFHIVGVTPEAPSLEAAMQGGRPESSHDITIKELRESRDDLTHGYAGKLDMVVLGSPHFSLDEFRALAPLLRGQRRNPRVEFLVTTNRMTALLAKEAGLLKSVEEFGGKLTVDTCILTSPMLPDAIQNLMTNSAKFSYYAPGLLNKTISYGSLEDCIRSSVKGAIVRDEALWE